MYLHNDIIDLTKVLKKDVPTRCVTICNDQAAGDGVRDPRADHSYRRDDERVNDSRWLDLWDTSGDN